MQIDIATPADAPGIASVHVRAWQVVGEHLIWSGTTESFAPSDAREASATFADVIVKALRAQGLL